MSQTGVRPWVLGSYRGEKGLTLGDLPELSVGGAIKFSEVPFVVRVPAGLSKTRVAYTTFGSGQLAAVMVSSLADRRGSGETLSVSSPIVAAGDTRGAAKISREARGTRFLTTKAIVSEVREALKFAAPEGTKFRPYSLRGYASTRLLLAEGSGLISRDLRESILGHDTGVSGRYHVGKKWGPELVEEARRQYRNASQFLETTSTTKVDVKAELLQSLLKAVEAATGKKADGGVLTGESLKQVLRDARGAAPAGNEGLDSSSAPVCSGAGDEGRRAASCGRRHDGTLPRRRVGLPVATERYDGGCRVAGNNPEWEVSPRSGGAERR